MAIVVAEKIIEMFFIMLCGIVLFKTGLIDDKTVPKLSNILLMLVSPLMIFQSYQMDFDGHLMWGLGLTLIAALTTFTVIIILTNILIRNLLIICKKPEFLLRKLPLYIQTVVL